MLGSAVATGSVESTDTSGHPVEDSLGASKELNSDQAGSARPVGEREGDGLFVLGDF